jgi:hypothetical protein
LKDIRFTGKQNGQCRLTLRSPRSDAAILIIVVFFIAQQHLCHLFYSSANIFYIEKKVIQQKWFVFVISNYAQLAPISETDPTPYLETRQPRAGVTSPPVPNDRAHSLP